MTPLKGAFLVVNPAGFLIYNKINYGTVWPFHHKKDKESLSTELSDSSSAASSSSSLKRQSKKAAKKDELELESELYRDEADAVSTSSEVAPPAYRR